LTIPDAPRPSRTRAASERFKRLAALAESAIVWEKTWPPLVAALTVAALFLAVSWLGFFSFAPRWARIGGVAAFAAGVLSALWPLANLRRPSRAATLARLDRDSGLPHRPASTIEDAPVNDSPEAAALWALHRRRAEAAAAKIAVAPPAPGLAARDVLALRFGVVLLAVAAAIIAGPERYGRVAAAFDWRGGGPPPAPARLDAWIDPPRYTGQAPILLTKLSTPGAEETVSAPQGSVVVLRGPAEIEAKVSGGLTPAASPGSAPPRDGEATAPVERRWTLQGDATLAVARDGGDASKVSIGAVLADKPTITLSEPPRPNASGSLTLSYRIQDQYGAASAEADFALPDDANGGKPHRALVGPPKMPLALPSAPHGLGDGRTTKDLADHAWAGARVAMTLKATNLAGAVGESAPTTVELPQRRFRDPLARALVEERRGLILDPDNKRDHVSRALGAMLIAPDVFDMPSGVYLGLSTARERLLKATDDAALLEVADLLWAIALHIEDGDAPDAQRDLRAAEQKLRDLLDRGASDAEIREAMKELREAAERYMRELAQNGAPLDDDMATLDSRDLENLLDKFEDTARNGARDDAEAMLDQLQNMFENMRSARRSMSPTERALRKELGELEKLLRDQQKLRDDTFRSEQQDRARRNAQRQNGQPQDDSDDSQSLQERQKELEQRLEALKRQLKELGAQGEKGFDDAQGAMGEAEGDLGQGDQDSPGQGQSGRMAGGRGGKGDAVDAQGRALQALREGLSGLQGQLQAEMGQGQGDDIGVGRDNRGPTQGQGQGGQDPLGREGPEALKGATNGLLGDTEGATERARRVLEELRRRLADPSRPTDERSYFERLLQRF